MATNDYINSSNEPKYKDIAAIEKALRESRLLKEDAANDRMICLAVLVDYYYGEGNYSMVIPMLQEATFILEKRGFHDKHYRHYSDLLIELYIIDIDHSGNSPNAAKADDIIKSRMKASKAIYGEYSLQHLRDLQLQGTSYSAQGKNELAMNHETKALNVAVRLFGKNSKKIEPYLSNLIMSAERRGDIDLRNELLHELNNLK